MESQATVAISGAVVTLTQLVKWAGLPDKLGPIAVLVFALMGVAIWGYSEGSFQRTQAFDYFVGWLAAATGAAGIFGFTRAATSAVTAATAPPGGGAGSSPTQKS